MIRTILRIIVTSSPGSLATVLFVLSPAIGSISSIAVLLLALVLSPTVFLRGSWRALRAQPSVLLLAAAFVLLTICFALTQTQPSDILLVTAFLGLLLAPVAYLLAWRRPGARTIAIIAALFALGAFVGAITASYDVFVQHFQRAIGWGSGGNLMARSVVPLGFMALSGVFAVRSPWRWLYLWALPWALRALPHGDARRVHCRAGAGTDLYLGLDARVPAQRAGGTSPVQWRSSRSSLECAVYSPRFLSVTPILEQFVKDPRPSRIRRRRSGSRCGTRAGTRSYSIR